MRIHVTSGMARKRPKVGETKLIKGVLHRREFMRDRFDRLVVNSRGGNRFEWVALSVSDGTEVSCGRV